MAVLVIVAGVLGAWYDRCNIRRVRAGSILGSSPEPYIVSVGPHRNGELARQLELGTLLSERGNMSCTPSRAGSVRRGISAMRLGEYLVDHLPRELSRDAEQNRYLFGEFGDQWADLRDAYVLPACRACVGDNAAVTIGIGGLHTGAPWHTHGAGYLEMLHGEKHFALLPPGDPVFPELSTHRNVSQYHWQLEQRPELEAEGRLEEIQECTIGPGELLYFPAEWYHGIINLSPYTVFVSTFLQKE
eukprot:Hpha_TRINITY_DN34290_c0_g1::TRINITY_DN34290_c0_g1_i1::g.34369::m.34369